MQKILLLLLFFALLSGCTNATVAGYKQRLNTWLGKPAKNLVNSPWGIPSRTFTMPDGNKVYCYTRGGYYQAPLVISPSIGYGSGLYGFGVGTQLYGGPMVAYWCDTCFFLNKHNRIVKYSIKGNDCVAVPEDRGQRTEDRKQRHIVA